jgi:hypothetical protein
LRSLAGGGLGSFYFYFLKLPSNSDDKLILGNGKIIFRKHVLAQSIQSILDEPVSPSKTKI